MVVPRIEELHRTIARAVIVKKTRLTPSEVRFLRTHLGWSGMIVASHMGVKPETVSRWENGHDRISPLADRLLRLMVLTQETLSDYTLDQLVGVDADAKPAKIKAEASKTGWMTLEPTFA